MNRLTAWKLGTVAVAALGAVSFALQHRTAAQEHAALRATIESQNAQAEATNRSGSSEMSESEAALARSESERVSLTRRVAELSARLENADKEATEAEQQFLSALRDTERAHQSMLQRVSVQMQRRVDSVRSLAPTLEERELVNPKGVRFTYYGSVRNGAANGFGIGFFETGAVYRGTWQANMRHGKGTFRWSDGDSYEGSYVNDQREGQGTYEFRSGERYVGAWHNDVREGCAEVISPDGKTVSRGLWRDDRLVRRIKGADSVTPSGAAAPADTTNCGGGDTDQ